MLVETPAVKAYLPTLLIEIVKLIPTDCTHNIKVGKQMIILEISESSNHNFLGVKLGDIMTLEHSVFEDFVRLYIVKVK